MSSSTNPEVGSLNLPSPSLEQANPGAVERGPVASPESAPSPSPAAPVVPAMTAGQTQRQAVIDQFAGPQDDSRSTTTTSSTVTADDSDLIEKEWVQKAKQIVENNREDPYKQSQELTIFRADYMQKQYNKTIKLGE